MFFYKEEIPTIVVPLHLTSSFNSLSFPSTCIGASSLLSVYVTAAQLSGSTVEIVSVGDDSDQFDQTPLSFALTGGVTNQIIDITFTPTSWGLKTATVILSASNGSVINVSLEGMAAAVPLVLTSSVNSLSFGTTTVNTISSMNVVVSAGGFTSVVETVTLSDNSNQFSFSPSSFSLTGSGTSRSITTTFSPTSTGVKSATLTLSSSGGNIKTISLQGTAVSSTAIDQYYNSTILLLKGDGANNSTSFTDSSPYAYPISRAGGVVISTSTSQYGGSSIYFYSGGSLTTNNSVVLSGDFTIESWIYLMSYHSNHRCIVGQWKPGTSIQCSFGLTVTPNGKLYLAYGIGSSNIGITTTSNTVPLNQWVHVAVTRSGTSVKFFVNGVQDATVGTTANASFNNSTSPLRVGASDLVSNNFFHGYIDDLRIVNGAAVYTSNFTAPGAL